MKHLLIPLTVCWAWTLPAAASIEMHVREVISEVRALEPMKQYQRYTLRAGGQELTGLSDDFLRRRSAAEIGAGGLSCGCGDYAILFLDLISRRGFEALLVDSAEISSRSLQSRYAGHAVVAVRAGSDSAWWLVDPTNRTVISRDWSLDEKSFHAGGHVYWIGYCGPLAGYPARNPEQLRKFYTETLAKVPREFFNRTLPRFRYVIDASLRDEQGRLLNPSIEPFLAAQVELFSKYGIQPAREVTIRLVRGENSAFSDLKLSAEGGWVSRVGLKSACSAGFISYLEATVRRNGEGDGRESAAPR